MMSHDLMKITNMEMDINKSINISKLELKGRYKLETQVFQSFTESPNTMFSDMIFNPEQ
ncbi:hypothetical protein NL491_27550 [Klebsiella pneumoniae]|nr:hypothetical protein [Klebsiella pneumoniae]